MRPRVVSTARLHAAVRERLSRGFDLVENEGDEPWDAREIGRNCREARGLVAFMNDRVDAAFLELCPNLSALAACLKGGDNIDLSACRGRGVEVHLSGDLLTEPTAELAVGLLLSLCRGIPSGDRLVRSGGFRGWRPARYGRTLRGSAVFVAGLGPLGRAVGRNLFRLGAVVRGCDPDPVARERALDAGIRVVGPEGIAEVGMAILCLPLAEETRAWMDRERIRSMPAGSLLVNVGRGSTVDEEAVERALESGHLEGYAADVYAFEDLSLADRPGEVRPGWTTSCSTLLTPHLGSAVGSVRLAIEMEAASFLEDRLLRPGERDFR